MGEGVNETASVRDSARPSPALSEAELRTWALEQFARLDDLATRTDIDLKDRQMVEAFVHRIEIEPESKTGIVYVAPDLAEALERISTREPIGDRKGSRVERVAFAWRRGEVRISV